MARKPRDYKAEYARRQARARQLGYSTVHQERKVRYALGIKRGKPTPKKSKLSPTRQRKIAAYSAGKSKRELAKAWSDKFSKHVMSKYNPKFDAATVDRYLNAWASDDPNNPDNSHLVRSGKGDFDGLRWWLVDYMNYFSPGEFDAAYKPL